MLPSDAENVYLTLTAKSMNPAVRVVSRISDERARSKLKRAGVDRAIFPFQADIRTRHQASLLAVRRSDGEMLLNPDSNVTLSDDDVRVAIGEVNGLDDLAARCRPD